MPRKLLYILASITFIIAPQQVLCQLELDESSGQSKSWSMLSVHRTFVPQERDFPNTGFGVQAFTAVGSQKRYWLGFFFRGTGVSQRDVLSIGFGPAMFIVGDGSLGLFSYLQSGIGIGSSRGITGFDLFNDPTFTVGFSTITGIGGSIELSKWLRLHLAMVGSWHTMERGVTPYGLQLGVTFGGDAK